MDRDSGGEAGCRFLIHLHCPDPPCLTVLKQVHFKSIRQSSTILNFDSIWAATPLLNNQSNLFLFSVNCAPLFGLCGPNLHCCADSMDYNYNYNIRSIYPIGIPIKQMPPSSPYTIKCSLAEYGFYERYGQNPSYQYHKANNWEKMFRMNRINRMNRYCLPNRR